MISDTSQTVSPPAPTVNYVVTGRWMLCYHCEAIVEFESGHYCGAPWQTPASDMPPEWCERAGKRVRTASDFAVSAQASELIADVRKNAEEWGATLNNEWFDRLSDSEFSLLSYIATTEAIATAAVNLNEALRPQGEKAKAVMSMNTHEVREAFREFLVAMESK
jgi:hypothetical protein